MYELWSSSHILLDIYQCVVCVMCHSSISHYFKASLSPSLLHLPPTLPHVQAHYPGQLVLGPAGWRGSWKWSLIHLLIPVLCCRILPSFNQWVVWGGGRGWKWGCGATRCSVCRWVKTSLHCFLGGIFIFSYSAAVKLLNWISWLCFLRLEVKR